MFFDSSKQFLYIECTEIRLLIEQSYNHPKVSSDSFCCVHAKKSAHGTIANSCNIWALVQIARCGILFFRAFAQSKKNPTNSNSESHKNTTLIGQSELASVCPQSIVKCSKNYQSHTSMGSYAFNFQSKPCDQDQKSEQEIQAYCASEDDNKQTLRSHSSSCTKDAMLCAETRKNGTPSVSHTMLNQSDHISHSAKLSQQR